MLFGRLLALRRQVTTCVMFIWQAISVTQAGKPEEKLELAFRLYDIDRNGSIEESEMAEIIKVSYASK